MAKWSALHRIYDFYTSDLNFKEVERLIKRDAPEVYDFYVKRIKQQPRQGKSLKSFFIFIRSLFVEFLQRLSPLRRIFYTIALLLFIIGYLAALWNWVFFSFIMLNLLLAFELADKLTAKNEIDVAREIQVSLMPRQAPSNSKFDISCYMETAREVGGDYYDFLIPGNDNCSTCLIIGDISGKGMGAALYMVQVQVILKYLINSCENIKQTLSQLNLILKPIFRSDTFFTVSAALIKDDLIHFCRAGHTPLIHYSRKFSNCNNVIPSGIGIGLANNGLFEKTLEEVEIKAELGDIFVFYTDGLTESMNNNREMFGEERLKEIIKKNASMDSSGVQDAILRSLLRFRNTDYVDDDITLIVMKAY